MTALALGLHEKLVRAGVDLTVTTSELTKQ
jgi:hypothetical protein